MILSSESISTLRTGGTPVALSTTISSLCLAPAGNSAESDVLPELGGGDDEITKNIARSEG